MPYILRKTDASARERRFVAPRGSAHSYTARRANARRFPTLEDAERDACGNERPEWVER